MEYCLAYVLKWDCKRALYFNWKIKSIAETTHYLTFIFMMFPRKRLFSTFLIILCHFDIFPHLWGWNRFFFNHPLVVTVSTIIEKNMKVFCHWKFSHFKISSKYNMGHFIPFLQTYPGPGATTPCGPDTCTGTRCSCTHTLKLDLGNVIEMVIFSFGKTMIS